MIGPIPKPEFLLGIGDEGGLHQHGGHGRTAQHHEGGLLDAPLLDAPQMIELGLDMDGQALGLIFRSAFVWCICPFLYSFCRQ